MALAARRQRGRSLRSAQQQRAGARHPAQPDAGIEASRTGRHSCRALREAGFDPKAATLTIEYRYAEGRNDRLPALAAELVQRKVDVIFANTTPRGERRQGCDDGHSDRVRHRS